MIGHKKHEESQREERQVLFLCLFVFFVAILSCFFNHGTHEMHGKQRMPVLGSVWFIASSASESRKTEKNWPADHPDEADEDGRMIGHEKHEESQREERQVLFLCTFVFFVATSLLFVVRSSRVTGGRGCRPW
jgi:hypothetical protein